MKSKPRLTFDKPKNEARFANTTGAKNDDPIVVALFRHRAAQANWSLLLRWLINGEWWKGKRWWMRRWMGLQFLCSLSLSLCSRDSSAKCGLSKKDHRRSAEAASSAAKAAAVISGKGKLRKWQSETLSKYVCIHWKVNCRKHWWSISTYA